jgi:hypothetical protein
MKLWLEHETLNEKKVVLFLDNVMKVNTGITYRWVSITINGNETLFENMTGDTMKRWYKYIHRRFNLINRVKEALNERYD